MLTGVSKIETVVAVVRMSAIGDVLIALYSSQLLFQQKNNVFFVTSFHLKSLLEPFFFVRRGIFLTPTWECIYWERKNDGSIVLSDSHDEKVTRRFLENRSKFLKIIDLHDTSRSRKACITISKEYLKSKKISVQKKTLSRLWMVAKSRWTGSQEPQDRKDRKVGVQTNLMAESNFQGLENLVSVSAQKHSVYELQSQLLEKCFDGADGFREFDTSSFDKSGCDKSSFDKPRFVKGPKQNRLWPTCPISMAIPQFNRERSADDFRYIAIFLGASGKLKAWPSEYFESVIRLLIEKTKLDVVLLGGADELHQIGFLSQSMVSSRVHNLVGTQSLSSTIALLVNAESILTGDSFAAHMAGFTKSPVHIIFGGTSPTLGFAPPFANVLLYFAHLSCSPCSRHGNGECRFKSLECLRLVSPVKVFQGILNGLDSRWKT